MSAPPALPDAPPDHDVPSTTDARRDAGHPATPPPSSSPSFKDVLTQGFGLVRHVAVLRRAAFLLAVLGAVLFVTAIVASSFVVGWLTDEVITPVLQDGVAPRDRFPAAAAVLLGVGLWKVAAITLRRTAAGWAQFGALTDLRTQLVDHQLERPVAWYARQKVGDLLAVNDTFVRQATGLLAPLPFSIGGMLLLVGATVTVTILDPVLGLMVGLSVLLIAGVDVTAAWATFGAFEDEMALRSEVSRIAHESVDGVQTIRALGGEQRELERFAVAVRARRDAEVVVARRFSWFRAFIETLPPALTVPVVVVGALRVGTGGLTSGDVVTVAYLVSLLTWPLALIGFLLWDTAYSLTAWHRVRAVLAVDETEPSGDDHLPGDGPLEVTTAGLHFAHGPDLPTVLHDVALTVASGSTVALVGPTGSGKSTLANLLGRLWQADTGIVTLDGRDVATLHSPALRDAVARVDQEAFLFGDTLRENVTLGRDLGDDEATQQRLDEVARLAALDGVIADLPQGWDTIVGERGTTLSGGQRQRVALARALLGRPRLLVLDDATSAVDPSVEARILASLRSSGATVVMVANRPASVALADEIIFLVDGRVVAVGHHDHLLATVPAYGDLLRSFERDAEERA